MLSRRWQRRLLPLLFSALLCVGLAIACDTAPNAPQTTSPAADASSDVLRLLYWQAPTILNPHLSNGFKDSEASRITLEPLASYDAEGNLVPFLAAAIPTLENGGIAPDGRSVTWTLKPGMKWSDGAPFSAADVVFTHQFVTDPAVGAISAASYALIESVEALDETTVKITFKEPNPTWSSVFVGTEGMVLPQHQFAEYLGAKSREAPANLLPVGTGPYRVVEFKPGDVVIFEPNPNYREADSLGFSRIELKGGGDAVSAARAVLQTGDVDFAYNLQVEAPILEQLSGRGEVVANFGSLMERILINFSDPNAEVDGERSHVSRPHPFLADPQVRQALSLAVDREAIATQLYGRTGKATANFLVSPESFSSPNTSYRFDLAAAQQTLEAAGWTDTNGDGIRDKNGIPLQMLFQTSVNPLRQKTQEILKQSWEAIGFRVELKSTDASVFFDSEPSNAENTGHFYADLQMYTTGNTNPDPAAYMKTYLCDEIAQKSNNWSKDNVSRYCNPAYEALWQQVASELDPAKRQDLFIQMNDLLVQDVAMIPLVHRAETAGVGDRLAGVNLTPWDLNTWNIAEWQRQ